MATSEQILMGRGKNAMLAYLDRRLSVPRIYIDATWEGAHLDLLAIDRDGVGDVHAVRMFTDRRYADGQLDIVHEREAVDGLLAALTTVPAHFKYIAAIDEPLRGAGAFQLSPYHLEKSFAPDGIGRVGFMRISIFDDEQPDVRALVRAERFRAFVGPTADEFVKNHSADLEVRA